MARIFSQEKQDIFELVSITDKYRIEGSSNVKKLIYYGDIDLLDIAKNKNIKRYIKAFYFCI